MYDLYYFQYQVVTFLSAIPREAILLALVAAAAIAYKFRTAIAVGGTVIAFLVFSGYVFFA